MEVALAASQPHVEVEEPARAEAEGRNVLARHRAVEDDAGVRAALVLGQEVDDRVAAGLLLPVECDPHVDGQLALARQKLRRLEQQVGVALVVGGAPRVQVAVADLRLERGRLPEVERRRRLHVEVAVEEDGRRTPAPPRRRGSLRPRAAAPPWRRARPPRRRRGRSRRPTRRPAARPRCGRVGAHARDAKPLGELLEPGGVELGPHGRPV